MNTYIHPSLKDIDLKVEAGFEASVSGGINPITEEQGEWS